MRLSDTAAGLPLYDNLSAAAATPLYSTEFRFAGRRYSLETAPVPQYWNQGQGGQTVGFLAAGLLGTGVLGGLLLLGTGYTARVESQVRERTQALLESEQRWHFALEGSGDGVWDWDVPAGEVLFSRRWYEIQATRRARSALPSATGSGWCIPTTCQCCNESCKPICEAKRRASPANTGYAAKTANTNGFWPRHGGQPRRERPPAPRRRHALRYIRAQAVGSGTAKQP